MKILVSLSAAAALAASLAAPAFAHSSATPHVHLPSGSVIYKGSRRLNQQFEIDPSILHPIPKPFPWPGPVCLSCPSMDLNPGQLVNPVLR